MVKINMPHMLVIGGTGFIGSNLIKIAKRKGWEVSCGSLHLLKSNIKQKDVSYYVVDLNNLSSLKKLNKDFDYVVNLGGYIDHVLFKDGGKKIIDSHFYGLMNLVEIISRTKLKRFVQIGSSDEYGNAKSPQKESIKEAPISPYSFAKTSSTYFLQMLHRTENFPAATLRLFLTYGPGQDKKRFIPSIIDGCLKHSKFPVSLGQQIRDFCYVEDTVEAILATLLSDNSNGQIFNVASGVPVTIKSVIEKIKKTIGKGEPQFGKVPYKVGENMSLYADISKIKKVLKWKPKTSFEEGIKKTIQSFK